MLRRSALLVPILFAGCATAPPKSAETPSGHPEITIASTDMQRIRGNLISRNATTGWILEQETQSILLFTRTDSSGSAQSAATQVLLGNAYSTPPKYEARYTLIPVATGTRVIVNASVSTQMPGGQVNRLSLSHASATFNPFQAQLERVKSEVESAR